MWPAFLEHLRSHGIDSRSAARKLSCLRGFYKWLLLDRRIHHDPTVNIESPKAWKVLPKSLAEPEVAEMLERAAMAASHPQAKATALRDRAILELLYAGGLRVSEVTALSTSDLALDAGPRAGARQGRQGAHCAAGPLRASGSGGISARRPAAPGAHQLGAQDQARRPRSRTARAALSLPARHAAHAAMGLAPGEDGRTSTPARTACATVAPRTWWSTAPTCAACRSARPRRHLHHAGLHAPGAGPAEGRASQHHPRGARPREPSPMRTSCGDPGPRLVCSKQAAWRGEPHERHGRCRRSAAPASPPLVDGLSARAGQ